MDGHEKAVFETGDQALKAANLSGVSRCFRSRSTVPSENEARRSSRLRPTESQLAPLASRSRLSDLEPRFVCTACGKRGADVRPDFNSDKPGALRRGY
jgi:hypothetical protein